MPLDPRVRISGHPDEVWLLEFQNPKGEWGPVYNDPALYDLEYNIQMLNRWQLRHRPRLRIRNVTTNEVVSGALFND